MATAFGRDVSCTTSLRTGRFSTGPRLVAEACFRRLSTPRGTLRGGEDEANYGLDLTELIGSSSTKSDAASLQGRIQSELKKDERVDSVDVTVTPSVEGPSTRFSIVIDAQLVDDGGAFSLVLLASAVTVELLGIKET